MCVSSWRVTRFIRRQLLSKVQTRVDTSTSGPDLDTRTVVIFFESETAFFAQLSCVRKQERCSSRAWRALLDPLATGLSVVEDLFPGVKELIGDTGNGLLSIDTHTRARARADPAHRQLIHSRCSGFCPRSRQQSWLHRQADPAFSWACP